MSHEINVRAEGRGAMKIDPRNIRDAVTFALDYCGIDFGCQVSVLITESAGIRAINKKHRNIDAETDVLSFPLQDLLPEMTAGEKRAVIEKDLSTGRTPLGDIILSADAVIKQAAEYGNTVSKEATYLTVHSVLHLLGHDHADEADDKRAMRTAEKAIMKNLGYPED